MNSTTTYETKTRRSGLMRRISSLVLTGALLVTTFAGLGSSAAPTAQAAQTYDSAVSSSALPEHTYDGVILHAWNWSFNSIKDNLPAIAEAGYTAVQTSPVQRPKDGSNTSTSQWDWWKVYQPTSLSFAPGGHPWFGSKEDFSAMCDEAEKYGIKIIVDVVANHLANNNGGEGNNRNGISSQNDPTYRDDDSCWHLNGSMGIDYGNPRRDGSTSSLTHGYGGWPDLNTGSKKVQNGVIDLLKECIDLGADGFRFDAAKHIELPTDPGGASDFWPSVTGAAEQYAASKGREIYCYGEILDDAGTDIKNYTKYMGVTDNRAANSIRYGIQRNSIEQASSSWLNYTGVPYSKIVLWSESHDTYANDDYTGESTKFSQAEINRSWAIIAARQFPALYYVRPDNPRSQKMGQPSGNTAWKDKEVVEVNKFHNAFVGESEYMSGSGNTVIVERGTSGVVLVNMNGCGSQVCVKVNKMKDGTYKDQVTGSTFTVSGGMISGTIGSKGVAVVYNASAVQTVGTVTATPTSTSFTDSLTVTLNANNLTDTKYTTSEGASGSFTSGTKITLGSSTSVGGTVTLELTGKKADGSSATAKYTYTKKDPNAVTKVYFDNSSYNWSKVYAYIYNKTGSSVNPTPAPTPAPQPTPSTSGNILFTNSLGWGSVYAYFFNANGTVGNEWPGQQMTSVGDNGYGSTNYSVAVPSGATSVVFTDNYGTQTGDLTLSGGVAGYWLDGSASKAIPWYSSSSSASAGSADTTPCNAAWPGQQMTLDAATGYYCLTVPDDFQNGLVIFSDGTDSAAKRYPADMEDGLPIGGTSMLFSAGNSWKPYTKVNPVPSKLSVTLKVSPSSVYVGETVRISASAANASGSVSYTYKAGSETLPASGSSAEWTPTSAGTTTITVTAKDSSGTATDTKSVTVTKKEEPKPEELVLDASASAATIDFINNKSVTFNASATGGVGPYEFAFYYKKSSTSSFTTLKDYSSSSTATFRPENETATYNIKIKVKDSNGTVDSKVLTVRVSGLAKQLSNESTISAYSIKIGSSVTVNCAALGGTKPYKYYVGYKKSSSSDYNVVQNYSTNSTVSIKPSSATVYNIVVKAKDNSGNVVSKKFDITVTDPNANKLKNTSALSAKSITLGKSVTINAAAQDGAGSYKYAAYYKKGSGDFKQVRDYSTTAKMTFKPTAAGSYTIRIKVKDKKNAVVNKDVRLTVTAAQLVNKSTLSSSTITVGNKITVNCAASGGIAPYRFAVYYRKSSSDSFILVSDYSTKTSVSIAPTTPTSYVIRVKVKDSSGKIAIKDLTVPVKSAAAELTNTSALSATTVKLGKSITVNCSAKGGKGGYQYAVAFSKRGSDSFKTVSGYTTAKTFTVKPSLATEYQVRVKVKDASGNVKVKYLYFNAVK